MHIENAYKKHITDIIAEAATDRENGLSSQEARNRLEQYGANELPGGERTSYIMIFVRKFQFRCGNGCLLLCALGISLSMLRYINMCYDNATQRNVRQLQQQ